MFIQIINFVFLAAAEQDLSLIYLLDNKPLMENLQNTLTFFITNYEEK